ncbi:MAG: prepilin-type N-terminal cleavage/methylation domain-containing protein [Planctomycetota bacterium]|nr:prepilin-type N-terminal cleavage/methylation domain-containing protein [Planctomycetota bacterium]
MKRSSTLHSYRHQGVTLIEMLIVIAIIGILAAILLPTIGMVRRSAQEGGMALEIQNLSAAIETYKQTYGDYPPDGSNIVVFQRHLQVAFPRIAPAEVANLINLIDLKDSSGNSTGRTIIDPAEALVFFLGGLSDDPRFPFTGEGGPLSPVRRNALFDFGAGRLTQSTDMINLGTANNPIYVPLSTDEKQLFGSNDTDIFPAYIPSSSDIPFIYLDHRTYTSRPLYSFNGSLVPPAQYPPVGSSFFQVTVHDGFVRAYRSDQARQSTAEDVFPFKWIREDSFQIICAGVDNNLGTALPLLDANGNPQHKQFPSQKLFSDGDRSNIANFSEGVLEGGL